MVASEQQTIIVVGNGMVGLRFCEHLTAFDERKRFRIVTFCEESRAAYDRAGLTNFFAHRDAEKFLLARKAWYESVGIRLHIGDRAIQIDRDRQVVRSLKGVRIRYDRLILATGSYPFVPPVPGVQKQGIFIYRTIEDLEHIIAYSKKVKSCAVIGGGLPGLEAAKAAFELGMDTHVIEFAPRLMPHQLDEAGSRTLLQKIRDTGVHVHPGKTTREIHGEGSIQRIEFTDGTSLNCDMLIVAAGIRPRDDLAIQSGLQIGERGGILVNDRLQTSDPNIFAIGECALHGGMIYGVVAPGDTMAETVAANFCGDDRTFAGTDLSVRLKLMNIDVASFGNYEAGPDVSHSLTWEDPISGVYKKLLFSLDWTTLLGGILVGDASDYSLLSTFAKTAAPLPCPPHELILGRANGPSAREGIDAMPDAAQLCSCNKLKTTAICSEIGQKNLESFAA